MRAVVTRINGGAKRTFSLGRPRVRGQVVSGGKSTVGVPPVKFDEPAVRSSSESITAASKCSASGGSESGSADFPSDHGQRPPQERQGAGAATTAHVYGATGEHLGASGDETDFSGSGGTHGSVPPTDMSSTATTPQKRRPGAAILATPETGSVGTLGGVSASPPKGVAVAVTLGRSPLRPQPCPARATSPKAVGAAGVIQSGGAQADDNGVAMKDIICRAYSEPVRLHQGVTAAGEKDAAPPLPKRARWCSMRNVGLASAAVDDDVAHAAGGVFVRGSWEIALRAQDMRASDVEAMRRALWAEARRLRRNDILPGCNLQAPTGDSVSSDASEGPAPVSGAKTADESKRLAAILRVYCDAGSARAVGNIFAKVCTALRLPAELCFRAGQPPRPLLTWAS